jgi:hypothetical protein
VWAATKRKEREGEMGYGPGREKRVLSFFSIFWFLFLQFKTIFE